MQNIKSRSGKKRNKINNLIVIGSQITGCGSLIYFNAFFLMLDPEEQKIDFQLFFRLHRWWTNLTVSAFPLNHFREAHARKPTLKKKHF